MRRLMCERCGQRVFFENVSCENCGAALGFVPAELRFGAFDIQADGGWQRVDVNAAPQRPCRNYVLEHVCNWMVPAGSADELCACCQTTDVIPALTKPENRGHWLAIEQAKRRLFYSLAALNLPAPSKAQDPAHGLSFHFLEQVSPKEKVLTGHDEGVITLNIAEADDARREQMRTHLHEPYRTLLGHFRHEIGHYYWDRLIEGSPWKDRFRALFGDESADYAEALKKHYATPLADWQPRFVSVYASSHPWEDWAECWAHYLHIQDGLETAAAWGLRLDQAQPGAPLVAPLPLVMDGAGSVLEPVLVEQWLPVSQFINAMDRSLGTRDSYPFVLVTPVIAKLEFIHQVVSAASRREVAMRFSKLFEPPQS
ncbi:putative zinc-binding metallopeptidase [soil metagenome]